MRGRDVLGQVAAALELWHDSQHRQQESHVARHRGLQGELVLHKRLDLAVELIDDGVGLGHGLGRLPIVGEEGVGRLGHTLSDECEKLHDLLVDLFEIPMEPDPRFFRHDVSPSQSAR
jgi:hypothetical protein